MRNAQEFGRKVREEFDALGIEYREYSGRSMYGKRCVGAVMKDIAEFGEMLVDVAEDDTPLARWLAKGVRTDGMGLDLIFYWPSAEWSETDDE